MSTVNTIQIDVSVYVSSVANCKENVSVAYAIQITVAFVPTPVARDLVVIVYATVLYPWIVFRLEQRLQMQILV